MVSTRRLVPTNWISGQTQQPSTDPIFVSYHLSLDLLVDDQISELGTVCTLPTSNFFSTWFLIVRLVFIPFYRLETLASNRTTYQSTCAFGMSYFDAELIVLQLSYATADTSMPQCPAHFHIPFTSVHFEADNATQALASTATVKPTINGEEEDVIICNGWTPEEKNMYIH